MRVLITRPMEDAMRTIAALGERGHEGIAMPLLDVRFHDGAEVALDGVHAVLATSANGVRALARRTARRDVPLFAVGPQTAQEAETLGFLRVRNAQGDSRVLAAAVAGWTAPSDGALLHVKSAEADGTLAALLKAQGFTVENAVLYDVGAIERLPPLPPDLDAALFYSARGAAIFRKLVAEAKLSVSGMIAICISKAAADALTPLRFKDIRVASEPNQDAMLALLS
ncbi:MAG TPA: uroporphyrinogen-III synthase [Rhizomicrobium sp.]|nr:uroporphyrinogen-III synthase [Rhizomicrobium sp.]